MFIDKQTITKRNLIMFNFANLGNVWASKEAYKGQPTSQLNSYRKNIYIKKYL